jgi:hypothetical protein
MNFRMSSGVCVYVSVVAGIISDTCICTTRDVNCIVRKEYAYMSLPWSLSKPQLQFRGTRCVSVCCIPSCALVRPECFCGTLRRIFEGHECLAQDHVSQATTIH